MFPPPLSPVAEKSSRLLSRDQRGPLVRLTSLVRRRGSEPSERANQMSPGPKRLETKATYRPSGEKSGAVSIRLECANGDDRSSRDSPLGILASHRLERSVRTP